MPRRFHKTAGYYQYSEHTDREWAELFDAWFETQNEEIRAALWHKVLIARRHLQEVGEIGAKAFILKTCAMVHNIRVI